MLNAIADGGVSGKFPHRVVELLDGYLTETSPLASKSLEPVHDFPVTDIVLREFQHTLDRQGQNKQAESFKALARLTDTSTDGEGPLSSYLTGLKRAAEQKLQKAKSDSSKWAALPQEEQRKLNVAPIEAPLAALIGLCQTVAFIERNLPKGS
jgi:hypothetical protein